MAISWKRVLTADGDAGTPSALVGTNISGTAASLTAGSATVSANNTADETVYPVFVDGATGSQGMETDTGLTYNPSTGMLTSSGFTGALTGTASNATTVTDDAITLAKMAGGTDGNIISYDTSGNPVAVATGDSGQVLTSGGAGAAPSFADPASSGDITAVALTADDSNTVTDSSGSADFTIAGGEGIDTAASGSTITIKVEQASATNIGGVELATTAETTTGTDAARAVTPDGLKDGYQGSANVTTLGTIATGVWSGTALVAGKVPSITSLTGYTAAAYANASSVGASSIVTVGTIASGTWEGTAIASAYLDSDTAHLSGTQTFTGAKTFSSNVVMSGNLTVSGATITTLAETVKIEDNIMVLNSGLGGSTAPSKDCGFTIERGNATDQSFFWDESLNKWSVGHSESSNEFTATGSVCMANNQTFDGDQDVVNGYGYIGSFQIHGANVYIRIS